MKALRAAARRPGPPCHVGGATRCRNHPLHPAAGACGSSASRWRVVQQGSRNNSSSSSGGSAVPPPSGGAGKKLATRPGLLAAYQNLLVTRPLPTKMVSGGVICAGGDLLCQLAIERVELGNVDGIRIARFFVAGSLLTAPLYHFWFAFLDRRFPGVGSIDSRRVRYGVIARKLATDQGLMPHFFNPLFILCLMTMEGKQAEWYPKMHAGYGDMLLANWQLWVPAQLVNFALVPVPFQVLFMNMVSVLWTCYMSWFNGR